MKSTLKCLLALALLLSSLPAFRLPTAAAQDRTALQRRVQFARGRTSTVIKNTIRRGTTHDYLLSARAGQTMIVHLVAKQSDFIIYTPNGGGAMEDADGVKDFEGALPETGEYTITIFTSARVAPYTLEITIR